MQQVIAGYESFADAEQAVRSLEPYLSIQDVLIADRHHFMWRRPSTKQVSTAEANFLVVMSGEAAAIERARQLLRHELSARVAQAPYPPEAEELADVAGADSFPASDPPCWTLGREKAPPTS